MKPTLRELAIDSVVLVSAVVVNVFVAPHARLPFRLLALFGLVVSLVVFARSLRRHDDARWGSYDLLVACDHQPEGVSMPALTRSQLWQALSRLDPEHHLVWINRQPFDPDDWKKQRR